MKDSTLYTILCVIVAIFCIFLGWKMMMPKQASEGKEETKTPQRVENQDNQNRQNSQNIQNNQTENTQVTKNETIKPQENKVDDTQNETISGSSVFYETVKSYEGKQSAYGVRSMLENVRNSNLLTQKKMSVEYKGVEHIDDIYELKSEFEGRGTYEVVFEYEKDSRRYF